MIKIQGNHYMSDFEAKKAMTEAGRLMEEKGYVIATDGSLSVKTGPNALWVTVEDARKNAMTQDMMVKVDLDGKSVFGARDKTLPEELKIHLKLYRENPDIRAVIHGYPPLATAMGIRGMGIEQAGFTKTLRKLGKVPVIPYTGGDRDAQAVSLLSGSSKGVLLQNNGCMAWGVTPFEALDMLEAMEYYGKVIERFEEISRPAESQKIPVKLKGVTELTKPGQMKESSKPEFFSEETSDVIHCTINRKEKPEKSKEDVMAEVVRKTMQNFHL